MADTGFGKSSLGRAYTQFSPEFYFKKKLNRGGGGLLNAPSNRMDWLPSPGGGVRGGGGSFTLKLPGCVNM